MSFTALARGVRDHLGQRHRFAHSLRVARFAEQLALRHGCPTGLARRAGLLHDLARLYPAERLLAESAAAGLPIGAFERAHPIVLHAPLGAVLARDLFGERDERVLRAIARHTVGDAEMSPLDTVVYLADALEPGRVYPDRERHARLAFDDLDAALAAVVRGSMTYLELRGEEPAPQTLAALDATDRRLAARQRSAIPA